MSTQMINEILVSDVMLSTESFPVIEKTVILKEALEEMGRENIGIVCIVDKDKKVLGIITDGDLRRKLLKIQKPFSAFFVDDALDHAIRSPITIQPSNTLKNAVMVMEEKRIWDIPVVDGAGVLVGLLHLHRAVQALIEK